MENRTSRREFLGRAAGALGLAMVASPSRAEEPATPEAAAADLRSAYDLDPSIVYLNHASVGTMPRSVREAREHWLAEIESDPRAHVFGDAFHDEKDRVRDRCARLLGCGPGEVAVSRNTTEAFHLLASGLALRPGDEVLTSSLNHVGATACFRHDAETRGYRLRQFDFPAAEVPGLTTSDLVRLYTEPIRERTRLLVLPHIDNIYGIRHPIREIAAAARERGVEWIAVDAAQSVGMVPVDTGDAGVDFLATSAHKWLQAAKGTGILFVRERAIPSVRPLFVTWGQARWKGTARMFEDYGTRDPSELLVLGAAIEFQQSLGARKERRLRELRDRIRARVAASGKLRWRSPRSWELGASLVAVEVPDVASSAVLEHVWARHRIAFRAMDSHGLSTVRLSPNVMNTEAEIDRFFDVVEREIPG